VCYLPFYSCAGVTVYSSSQFGQGTGPIFFTDVGCTGSESSLLMCSRNVFGVTSCTHSRDVGLKCEGMYNKQVCIAIIFIFLVNIELVMVITTWAL